MRNELAEYAHNAWSGWMVHLFQKSVMNDDGTCTIPAWAVERWMRQIITPYDKLPEEDKKSDLAEADIILEIIQEYDSDDFMDFCMGL